MNSVDRSFPLSDLLLFMLQLVGFLAVCMIAVFAVYFGSVALATKIVIFALRFGSRAAKYVRTVFITLYVLTLPTIIFLYLTTSSVPLGISIILATVVLCGFASLGVVIAEDTKKLLKNNSSNNSPGY